jgi:hypothetical protein
VRAISDVVQVMIAGVREGKVINLNAVKAGRLSRHSLPGVSQMVMRTVPASSHQSVFATMRPTRGLPLPGPGGVADWSRGPYRLSSTLPGGGRLVTWCSAAGCI